MLTLRVVRLSRRAPRCVSSAWDGAGNACDSHTQRVGSLGKLPLSTTRPCGPIDGAPTILIRTAGHVRRMAILVVTGLDEAFAACLADKFAQVPE